MGREGAVPPFTVFEKLVVRYFIGWFGFFNHHHCCFLMGGFLSWIFASSL